MPIYEYRCTSCQDEFEVIQKMNDRPLRRCKKCSGSLEKQISRAAFQLKGDGWFSSGYSKASGKAGAAAESKASAESTSSTDAKSPAESKASATTSEPKPKKEAGKSGSGSGSGTKGKPTAASA